jgi:polyphosphate kinase 2 (PPK2 family)
VLVERVEGFATQDAWMRAYSEINDFEEQLATAGGILVKCWLAVTKDEQLRRFKERERTRFKRFKITQEDWRNRDKWGAYEQAANDMLERTSSDVAPWTIIEANDKHLARIRTLTTLCDAIEARL